MRTIYNKISNIINNIIDSVFHSKYNPIATKNMVNSFIKDIAKNKYFIKALRDTQSHIIDDIKAIQLTIKSMREDYESLKNKHNQLATDYNSLKCQKWTKHTLLDTPFKDDDDTLKKIAKILVPYDNDGINLNIDDVVDDINDVFNGFTNTYNDVCDNDNNINLTK